MKRTLLPIILIFSLLIGCSAQSDYASSSPTQISEQSQSSHTSIETNNNSSIPNPSNNSEDIDGQDKSIKKYSIEERKKLLEYVEVYSATFDSPYSSPNKLDQNAIGWFSFWRIYEDNALEVNETGYCTIPKKELSLYVFTHFGVEEYEYTDELPFYDTNKDEYQFFPIGEKSLNEINIEKSEYGDDNTVVYTVNITTNPISNETPTPIKSKNLKYLFAIKENDGICYLEAISAQY